MGRSPPIEASYNSVAGEQEGVQLARLVLEENSVDEMEARVMKMMRTVASYNRVKGRPNSTPHLDECWDNRVQEREGRVRRYSRVGKFL